MTSGIYHIGFLIIQESTCMKTYVCFPTSLYFQNFHELFNSWWK